MMKNGKSSLEHKINAREVDSVILCVPDVHGRLVGERVAAEHFAGADKWRVRGDLLSPAMENKHALFLHPDVKSARILPWLPATALVPCDIYDEQNNPVTSAPRHILQRQQLRLRQYGPWPKFAARLQCYLFEDNYNNARSKEYRDLLREGVRASTHGIWEGSRQESLLRAVRTHMSAADVPVVSTASLFEGAQHEIKLAGSAPMESAEHLVLLKHGMKELAALHDRSATFMANWNDAFPSSGCILASTLSADDPEMRQSFLAGQLALAREMCLFFAPFANSYRRLGARGRKFCKRTWERDDPAAGLRVMEQTLVEWEWGGADMNPYLAYAAIIIAGLHGVEQKLELPPEGEVCDPGSPCLPASLQEAMDALDGSKVMRGALGDDVVEFYLANAHFEENRSREILSWQLQRGFEQT